MQANLSRHALSTARGICAGLLLAAGTTPAVDLPQRSYITVVGSSTAYPIVAAAAEHFARDQPGRRAPVVESTGTGGGFKLFCSGKGPETPDVVMASRQMKPSELARCRDAGVDEIAELKIGYDGIVFASTRGAPGLRLQSLDLYLALAREVPDPGGTDSLVSNPYGNWQEINPDLPDLPIRVYGPPPTSGTRDILVERLLESACRAAVGSVAEAAGESSLREKCQALREDGAWINAGENDARLVRKLVDDPAAVGVFGYNFLDRNRDKLQAATVDGTIPEFEAIETGAYRLSRPLYLYVKRAHVEWLPALPDFLRSIARPAAWGGEGYLVDHGLIPLQPDEQQRWAGAARLDGNGCLFPKCP